MDWDTLIFVWLAGIPFIALIGAITLRLRLEEFRGEDEIGFSVMMLLLWPILLICLFMIAAGALLLSPAIAVMYMNSRRKRKNDELATESAGEA